jgi:hypothetical protein
MFAHKLALLLISGFAGAAGVGSQPMPALFYDPAVPQLAFAASEIAHSAPRALPAFPVERLSSASCSLCIVMAKELRLTLGDIEAMSDLARYYAAKIRGAAELALFDGSSEDSKKQEALRYLQAAAEHWRSYSRAYTAQYTQPHLYNRVGFVSIPALTEKALADVEIARQWKPRTVVDGKAKRRSADQPFRK